MAPLFLESIRWWDATPCSFPQAGRFTAECKSRCAARSPARCAAFAAAACRFPTPIPASAAILQGGLSDQDLLPLAADFNHPIAFFGSASEDRKDQMSLASVLDIPYGARLGLIAHFASPLPQTLFLPASDGVGGEIFRTDVTGDGAFGGQSQTGASAYGDILPGTNIGSFGRAVKQRNSTRIIQTYNSNFGNQLTPAGQALVTYWSAFAIAADSAGGGFAGHPPAPADNPSLAWLRTFDLTLSRPLKIGDRFVFEPSVSAFNILNFANFDGPGNRLLGALNGRWEL